MHRPARCLFIAVGIASIAGCGRSAPAPPPLVLSVPSDTMVVPYTAVTRAVRLTADRWAITTSGETAVRLIDFKRHLVTSPAGPDSTPRNPATIFTSSDTLYVSDWGLRRLFRWTDDGRAVRSIPISDIAEGAFPAARDATGRFYAEIASPTRTGAAGFRDSAAVVRTQAGARVDTVARLAPLDVAEVVGDQGRRFERRVFSGTDKWGAIGDGSVWVARVYGNRVDWRSPNGTWTKGQALPDRVLEVTRYDREMFIRSFPKELRSMAQQLPFAAIKPPFEDAFTASDGTVWLVKSRAPTDSAGQCHVVGTGGRLLRDVRVPGNGRAVGASGDAVIVAEPTRQGVRLLRFALPPAVPEKLQ